jgi:uncharacterized protein YbaA (DUF1428 family)
MPYVDGYVIPMQRKNVEAYRRMAAKAGRIWVEHGALEYRECVADDLAPHIGGREAPPVFSRMTKLNRGETVLFSWIVFRSRAHRDQVNAKVLKDPRITATADRPMPFDTKRMAYAGFKTIVDLGLRKGPRSR